MTASVEAGLALAPVATVWFTKLLIDALISGRDVAIPVVGLAATAMLLAFLPKAATYARGEGTRRVSIFVRVELSRAMNRFVGLSRHESPAFINRLRLAEVASRFAALRLVDGVIGLAAAMLTTVAYAVSLATIAPLLALTVVAAAIPALLARLWLGQLNAVTTVLLGPAERREGFYGQLLSSVKAAKEIRLFRLSRWLCSRMVNEMVGINAEKRRVAGKELRIEGGLGFLGSVVAAAGLVWAAYRARAGELTPGDVAVLVGALAGTQSSLANAVSQAAQINEGLISTGHLVAVIDSPPDLPTRHPATGAPPVVRGERGLVLDNVWFRYAPDQPWILQGLTLTIPHGAAVGLVGTNGAGKSTIVKLLCRFYDPERGAIRWNGVDLRHLDPAELRSRIGAVFQDFMAYDLTAAENIAVGDLHASREQLMQAAWRAGAHEMIERLDRGYDTPLSQSQWLGNEEHGVSLSGGQWQRLALARALMRQDCELMILDEPSSALDPHAEHEVHTLLTRQRRGRTSVLVSHRLGALRDADVLVVLDGGTIVEMGTHKELMAFGGRYASMYTVQASGYNESGRMSNNSLRNVS